MTYWLTLFTGRQTLHNETKVQKISRTILKILCKKLFSIEEYFIESFVVANIKKEPRNIFLIGILLNEIFCRNFFA